MSLTVHYDSEESEVNEKLSQALIKSLEVGKQNSYRGVSTKMILFLLTLKE